MSNERSRQATPGTPAASSNRGDTGRTTRTAAKRWNVVATALLALVTPVVSSGCNAGTIGIVLYFLLDDDDGRRSRTPRPLEGPVDLSFVAVENHRRQPDQTLVAFRLTSEGTGTTEVRVEFSTDGVAFAPVAFRAPIPGTTATSGGGPGMLTGLRASPAGVVHRFGWDAPAQLGGTALSRVTLRLTAGNILDVPVLIGNDAPRIEAVSVGDARDGIVRIEVVISDSSSDDALLAIEVAPASDRMGGGDFAPTTLGERLTDLPTSRAGERLAFTWHALDDLGPLDRDVIVRVVPRDLIGASTEGVGEPHLESARVDLNADPVVESVVFSSAGVDGDRRRGLGVVVTVSDAEADDVDLILQWSPAGEGFPELPASIDSDAVARESLLLSAEAAAERGALRIVTLRPQPLDGPVEDPDAASDLATNEVLATWLRHEPALRGGIAALAGRRVRLLRASSADAGDGASVSEGDERVICGYSAARGVLTLDAPFAPIEAPGDRLLIDIGRALSRRAGPTAAAHALVWASEFDAPGGGDLRLRATPFDRAFAAPDDPFASCEPPLPYSLEGALPGERGVAAETGGSRGVNGPFGARGAWALPLAPVDLPAALASADLDADGRLDVIAANRESRSLVLFFQTAPGSFDELRLLDARIGEPSDVLVEDLDGDGDLDIALTSSAFTIEPDPPEGVAAIERSGSVLLYFQEADLDFIPHRVSLSAGASLRAPTAVVAADFDGDGDVDLAVSEGAPGLASVRFFYRGTTTSSLVCDEREGDYSVCRFAIGGAGGVDEGVTDIVAGDFDGDGAFDLLYATTSTIGVAINDARGGFPTTLAYELPGADLRAVAALDVDGDGELDLLGADVANSEVVVIHRDGPLLVAGTPLRTSNLVRPVALVAADIDGNGRRDLVIADEGVGAGTGHVTVCLADAAFGLTCDALQRGGDASPRDVAVGDFDGDGLVDLVSTEEGPREVAIWLQEAPGSFSTPGEVLREAGDPPAPTALAANDIDSDGEIDLAIASSTSALIAVALRAPGEAPVSLVLPAEESSSHSDVALGDLDGDGVADLAAADMGRDEVIVAFLERAPRGGGVALGESVRLASTELLGPQALAIGDVDGDGLLDVLVAGRFSGTVLWFPQESARDFAAGIVIDRGDDGGAGALSGPLDVVVADFDADGRLDVAIAVHSGGAVRVLRQTAERGVFTATTVALDADTRPTALAARDLDGDGDVDLAVATEGRSALVILDAAAGGFTPRDLGAVVRSGSAAAIAAADVDADGRVDLVLASPASGTVEVLRATTGGTFAPARVLTSQDLGVAAGVRFVPVALLVLDVDGDAEADIVVANRAGDVLTVFPGGR